VKKGNRWYGRKEDWRKDFISELALWRRKDVRGARNGEEPKDREGKRAGGCRDSKARQGDGC